MSLAESLYSQEKLVEGRLYKDARILTKNGNIIRASFIYSNDSINILLQKPAMEYGESMQKISRIEIKSDPHGKKLAKNIVLGTTIGFGVGLGAAYIVYKKGFSEPVQYLVLVGSTSIGFVIGITKKTFKPIYSSDNNVLNKIDYNIYYNAALNNLSLNLTYNF